jgi:hypothetical protein
MKIKSLKILGLLALMVFALSSCEEDGVDIQRGVGAVPKISNLNPAVFFPGDLNNTAVQFTLNVDSTYNYTGDVKIVVSKNGDKARKEVTSVNTFPATVNIKLADIAALYGVAVTTFQEGDLFTIEAATVEGGKTYYSAAAFNAPLVCFYDTDNAVGAYRAVSAGWAVNGPVTITLDGADQYKVWVAGLPELDGATGDVGPLEMNINPLNYQVTAPKTVLCSNFYGYTNMAYQGSGIWDSCVGTYSMSFTITVVQGSFGTYSFTFTKL